MALYHNLGNGKFEDVTKKAGLDPSVHAIGCTAGDYDNDGATDLAVSLNGRVLLLHNEKNGTFKDVTDAAGIKAAHRTSATSGSLSSTTITTAISIFMSTRYRTGSGFDPRIDIAVANRGVASPAQTSCGATTATALHRCHQELKLGLDRRSVSAIGTDYNNDRAVDIVVDT